MEFQMPYVKPDSERGPIGAWLRNSREAKNWSVEEVVERLDEVGHGIRADYYRQLEAGPNRVPSPPLLAALVGLFGSEPDWQAPMRGMHRIEALRTPHARDYVASVDFGRKSLTDDPVVAQLLEMYRDQQRDLTTLKQEVLTLAAELERLRLEVRSGPIVPANLIGATTRTK